MKNMQVERENIKKDVDQKIKILHLISSRSIISIRELFNVVSGIEKNCTLAMFNYWNGQTLNQKEISNIVNFYHKPLWFMQSIHQGGK